MIKTLKMIKEDFKGLFANIFAGFLNKFFPIRFSSKDQSGFLKEYSEINGRKSAKRIKKIMNSWTYSKEAIERKKERLSLKKTD